MPQFQTIKSVFNGGEMSPLMDGRTDSEKYATGCRLLENFIVRPYGGVFKRPGTQFGVADSNTADCVRLIPFRRSTSINFVLGFKQNAIKVWSYSAGVFTLVTTLVTTYSSVEIKALHYCQLNDIMYLTCSTQIPKIITRASDGTWSITNVPFQFAPTLDPPSDGVTLTILYNANPWVSGTSYVVGNYVIYNGVFYRCITNNSDAAFTGAKWTAARYLPSWNVTTAPAGYTVGDVVEYFGSNYWCITTHSPASSANRPGVGAQWVLISILDYQLHSSSPLFSSDEFGSIWLLSPGSTNRLASETVPAAAATTTSATVFIQGGYTARTNWASGSAPSTTTFQLQESLDRINFTSIKEWYVNSVQEGTILYTSEAPSTGAWYRFVAIKTAASGTTSTMTIEPATGKLDIPFKITNQLTTSQATGESELESGSLIPNEVIGTAFPVWRKSAFSANRGYPRTVAFHDQRLWFAGTTTEPMRMWGSQTDDFYTFLTGALATSGIDVTLAATQANDIQWIASFNRQMVVGTTGEEWTLDSGEQDTALTPANVRLSRRSRYGSSSFQPILAGDALLWLTRDNRLREFAYVFEKDGFSAPEMTLLAEHIPSRSNIIQISYSQSPDPVVWFVHLDGTWSGFTYDRENNVTAWHRHRSYYGCLSLCTLYSTETSADALIFLVPGATSNALESIDGATMIAAMTSAGKDTEVWCMDSWVSLSGTASGGPLLTFTGVTTANPNLVVGTPVILGSYGVSTEGDGVPVEVNVTSGASGTAIFFSADPTGSYKIGTPFTAYLIPNRMEIQLQDGSAQMRKWRVTRFAARLWKSYYGQVVQKLDSLDYTNGTRIDTVDIDAYPEPPDDTPTTLDYVTGQTLPQVVNFDWGPSLDVLIASRHPVPFNVISTIMEVEILGTSGAAGS